MYSADVQKIIEELGVKKLPINPFEVITHHEWDIITYPLFAQIMNTTERDMREKISYFSFCFYSPDSKGYIFVYNKRLPRQGIIFALAHELGHVFYGDISPQQTFKRRGIDIAVEDRANEFACTVLGARSKEEFIGPENIF